MENFAYNPNRPLAEQVAQRIKEYILGHNLQPGDKLPTEAVMAQNLGVARSTVREAVKRLESQNIITVRQGSGSFVAEQPGLCDDPLGLDFVSDRWRLAGDLLEIRLILEPALAELAARHATPKDLLELEQLYVEMERHITNGEAVLTEDMRFHQVVCRASGNIVGAKLAPLITEPIRISINEKEHMVLQETLDSHHAILEAIRLQDGAWAKDAMLLHLTCARNQFRNAERVRDGFAPTTPKVPNWVLALDELKEPQTRDQ